MDKKEVFDELNRVLEIANGIESQERVKSGDLTRFNSELEAVIKALEGSRFPRVRRGLEESLIPKVGISEYFLPVIVGLIFHDETGFGYACSEVNKKRLAACVNQLRIISRDFVK